ncbi:aminotransferase class I/II-fold pyridoxal phosphate-dependent enzyme [Cohnella sp. CFH 77786]|uniref:MocR-like pyridoxine biosynthesis transcription factor PdxR n=1 Tax=Cohnella sp. CFH 77786 TaxID=2662265 RepID=UPI001C610261|nr:PLP-dependent aminotransferase family protein [Cohnella sp. CFH 77786]MBW5447373.1 aminotransferase class I/II-fold pyridoxal phosphate-dependent enzyme [Cohnella sp. CFH 77786]
MTLPIAYAAKLAECGSKHMALYQALRDAIADGLLPQGERLPSTRKLASVYGLSRGSVSLAYEMLAAEGYVRAGVGQGTFVAGPAEDGKAMRPGKEAGQAEAAELRLTQWGKRIAGARSSGQPRSAAEAPDDGQAGSSGPAAVSFIPQNIGARWFPWAEWRSVVSSCWKSGVRGPEEKTPAAAGSPELRRAIAGRLRRERGIRCEADDIVITGGSMQAIALLAQLLLEEGRTAVAENPGYAGIRRAVLATGARLVTEEADEGGIVPRDWDADVLFVTPARQFPTGAVLAYERRLALLGWASRRGAWIVEDDYDSDFRWGGRPIEPLKALDRERRVVYIGTFSRSMRTEVRIGYAVVPAALREAFIAAKTLYEPYPTGVTEQRALAEWMAQGGYDRHMRRMRRIYGKLEGTLRSELETHLGHCFRVLPSDAGLHLYALWRRDPLQYEQLKRVCRARGVEWKDGADYEAGTAGTRGATSVRPPSALFGFAHMDEERIREGIGRIGQAAAELGFRGEE